MKPVMNSAISDIVGRCHVTSPVRDVVRKVRDSIKTPWKEMDRTRRRYIIAAVIQTMRDNLDLFRFVETGYSETRSPRYLWNPNGETAKESVIIAP